MLFIPEKSDFFNSSCEKVFFFEEKIRYIAMKKNNIKLKYE